MKDENGRPLRAHEARKALFRRGLERGWLTREEIDAALPPSALLPNERLLLLYSLGAAGIEVRDGGNDGDGAPRVEEDAEDPAGRAA